MLLINALLIDSNGQRRENLRITDDVISAVGALEPQGDETVLDCTDKWVMPGIIDLNFHLNDPGHKRIESIEESAKRAFAGGITTIVASSDTNPAIDNETVVEYIATKASTVCGARVRLMGEVASQHAQLNDIAKLFKAGVCALETTTKLESNLLRRAFEYALMAEKPVFVACQNSSLELNGVLHDGVAAAQMGLPALVDFAESSESLRVSDIAQAVGATVIIKAISAKRTFEALKPRKHDRLFLQTLLPHLLLTDSDCLGFNTACKISPPLRSASDQEALIGALASGAIDILSSGHLPQDESSRDRPFELSSDGMDIAAIFLPLAYTYLIGTGKMKIEDFVRAASFNPARILGEPCGVIAEGKRADLVVFDPNAEQIVVQKEGVAKNFWNGKRVSGKVICALIGGAIIDTNGKNDA